MPRRFGRETPPLGVKSGRLPPVAEIADSVKIRFDLAESCAAPRNSVEAAALDLIERRRCGAYPPLR
ncbi:MAG TPA: hypothetical protein VGN55_16300, partial [Xanthobacteraceae bacterium]